MTTVLDAQNRPAPRKVYLLAGFVKADLLTQASAELT